MSKMTEKAPATRDGYPRVVEDELTSPTVKDVEDKTIPGEVSQVEARAAIVSRDREVRFLKRVGLNSLDEAETVMRENREELEQFRQLTETVKEIEGVEDLVGLIEKINGEREAIAKERSGWHNVSEEFRQLASVAQLLENERFVDRFHSMSNELQILTEKVNGMTRQAEVEEGKLLFYKNKVEQLEKQNAILLKEQRRSAEQSGQNTGKEDSKKGQMGMGTTRTSVIPSGVNAHNEGALWRNSDKVMGRSIGMMANALPEMAKYSGEKEDWDDFETGFMIRYGGMKTQVAMSLLKDHLEGEAKDALRSISFEEKAKGVKSVLKWLRSRLSNETPFEELELHKMLQRQTVDGKSVGKICEELEELTVKLYGNNDSSTEAARRRQLLILYEGMHVEHARLLSLFMEGESYAKMKEVLVELEYLRTIELRSHNGMRTTSFSRRGVEDIRTTSFWRNGMEDIRSNSFARNGSGDMKTESFSGRGYMGDQ